MTWTATARSQAECSQQPDGRWRFQVEFVVKVYTYGAGTVRYQRGRGAGDHRSEVRTYTVDKAYERHVSLRVVSDTISGSTDAPTDTVVEYVHFLEQTAPTGRSTSR
jgi:hypothetical protein